MVKFFTPEEEQQIIGAIREVEGRTSGEVRVHLARDSQGEVFDEATQTFFRLKMHETRERNGVLVFLVPKKHRFAIIGDRGINAVVPPHFWEDVRDAAQDRFREQQFAEGIILALRRIGDILQEHFPYRENDRNELPDELSYD